MSEELSPEDEELLREELRQLTAYYRREALKMIRDAKDRKDRRDEPYKYRDLADDLLQYGVDMEHQALINRLNRGTFSFAFGLQVLAALGVTHITIPQPPPELRPSFSR
jgi:hypothetical protein